MFIVNLFNYNTTLLKLLFKVCILRVLWCSVCFCTGHFVMVPINLTCPHCLQHFFFEHLFHLYYHLKYPLPTKQKKVSFLFFHCWPRQASEGELTARSGRKLRQCFRVRQSLKPTDTDSWSCLWLWMLPYHRRTLF